MVTRCQSAGSARDSGLANRAVQKQVRRAREPAAYGEAIRLEDVHIGGDPDAEHAREVLHQEQRVGVTLLGG